MNGAVAGKIVTAAAAVVVVGLAVGMTGCSSTSSPSEIIPWYVGASWVAGADFTTGSTLGASLVWDGDDALYTGNGYVPGENAEFWRYNISTDSWTQLGDPPIDPYWSASLAWTGGDEMYAIQGNGSGAFYSYTISTDDWTAETSFPASGVRRMGHSLVWPGSGNYVYLARGNQGSDFARYDTATDEWTDLASIPESMGNGTQISWGGRLKVFAATDNQGFYSYNIGTDLWSTKAACPESLHFGAWMCYDEDESLFLARGDTTTALWRYDIPGDSWEPITDIPVEMKAGGTMVCADEALYLLPGGGSTDLWIFKR